MLVDNTAVTRCEMRGREMDGWLHLPAERVQTEGDLSLSVSRGAAYVRSLPPKESR